MGARRRRQTRPVQRPPAAETAEFDIESLGARGDGIARHRGGRVFIPFALPGERVRARPGAMRADGTAGDLEAVLLPATTRCTAACAHFGHCGGCQIQHMDAAAQASWKTAQIAQALAHHGIVGAIIRPIVTTASATRRRTGLAAERRHGRFRFGYRARRSHGIVDIAACPILEPALARLIDPLRALAQRLLRGDGAIDLMVTRLDTGVDLLVEADAEPSLDDRVALADFAGVHDLVRVSWRGGGTLEPIAERRQPTVTFAGVPVIAPPAPFLQASVEGEAAIVAAVAEGAADAAAIADLYAGLGTFTFALARRARVRAVEGDADAVDALSAAVRRANLAQRVSVERRDLAREPLSPTELAPFDTVVFDPPRAGAEAQSTALGESVIKNAVAVSCNPATFARDAKILRDRGMTLNWVQPVDQFVWSARVELVASFTR